MIGAAAFALLSACSKPADSPVAPLASTDPNATVQSAAGINSPTTLVISEIMANPNTPADADGEWFEIHNPGTTDVSLTGFVIASANDTPVTITGAVSIPAGGYGVLANNPNNSTNGNVNPIFAYPPAFVLNNSTTDWLVLRDASGATIDSVAWGSPAATAGSSRAKRAMVIDCTPMADERAWGRALSTTVYTGSERGTPGAPNQLTGYTAPNLCAPQTGGPVATVSVTPNPGNTSVGGTVQLAATPRDANGVTVSTTFTWLSGDTQIATVSATGLVTGVAIGSTTVTATSANGIQGVTTINVAAAGAITSVTIGNATIPVGFQTQIFGTARDASNTVIPNTTFTWSVDPVDASKLSVDANGVITALAAGTARLIATAPNGVFGSNTITIEVPVAANPAVYANNVEFGTPTDANSADDFIITRPQSSVSYNKDNGIPNWVSYNLDNGHFGSEDRCNCFTNDPLVIAQGFPVIKTSDYTNGGFDRGHMMRSADRTLTNLENAVTFYLSNVVPQQADLNQGVWASHEIFLADLARVNNKELYIITGPAFTGPARTIKNEGKIRIPDATWKIAVAMDRGKGVADIRTWEDLASVQVIAVNMPNIAGIRNANWRDYQVTVDALEALTGYNFLSALPDSIENAIEAGDRPPVANLSGPTNGVEGATLSFSGASSTDPDAGDVLTYRWEFSDGSTATGATASKVFIDNGTYTVKLFVADKFGWTVSAMQSVTVSNANPVATLGTPSGTSVKANTGWLTQLRFTDAGTQDGPWRVRYDWGDGTSFNATLTTPPSTTPLQRGKTWSTPGQYVVKITVTDKDGGVSTNEVSVTVTP
jgi:DNA/RNA endonuclease G (NUC1)